MSSPSIHRSVTKSGFFLVGSVAVVIILVPSHRCDLTHACPSISSDCSTFKGKVSSRSPSGVGVSTCSTPSTIAQLDCGLNELAILRFAQPTPMCFRYASRLSLRTLVQWPQKSTHSSATLSSTDCVLLSENVAALMLASSSIADHTTDLSGFVGVVTGDAASSTAGAMPVGVAGSAGAAASIGAPKLPCDGSEGAPFDGSAMVPFDGSAEALLPGSAVWLPVGSAMPPTEMFESSVGTTPEPPPMSDITDDDAFIKGGLELSPSPNLLCERAYCRWRAFIGLPGGSVDPSA